MNSLQTGAIIDAWVCNQASVEEVGKALNAEVDYPFDLPCATVLPGFKDTADLFVIHSEAPNAVDHPRDFEFEFIAFDTDTGREVARLDDGSEEAGVIEGELFEEHCI